MSTPSRTTLPEVGVSSPASSPKSVLLPLPEAPMIATNCPAGISRSMPRRMSTRWLPLSRLFVRFRTVRIAEMTGTSSIMEGMSAPLKKSAFVVLVALASLSAQTRPASPRSGDTRKVLVVFGDSLSAGYGLPAGKSCPDDTQRTLDTEGYAWRVVNLGISGDTTAGGVSRIQSAVRLKPSLILLELGGNDGLRGLPLNVTRQNLEKMITEFQQTGAKVVLAGMTLPP